MAGVMFVLFAFSCSPKLNDTDAETPAEPQTEKMEPPGSNEESAPLTKEQKKAARREKLGAASNDQVIDRMIRRLNRTVSLTEDQTVNIRAIGAGYDFEAAADVGAKERLVRNFQRDIVSQVLTPEQQAKLRN